MWYQDDELIIKHVRTSLLCLIFCVAYAPRSEINAFFLWFLLLSIGESCKLVDVHGYQVKASFAPILEFIFAKFGDIARDCIFKHPNARIFFLEMVCNVVAKLMSTERGVTPSQLREMISDISDAAGANLNITWLQDFLEAINPAEEVVRDSRGLMEQRAASYQLVKAAKKDMDDKEREFLEAEERWKALKLASINIENEAARFLQVKWAWKGTMEKLLCHCRCNDLSESQ